MVGTTAVPYVPRAPQQTQTPPVDLRSGVIHEPGARAVSSHPEMWASRRVGAHGIADRGVRSLSTERLLAFL